MPKTVHESTAHKVQEITMETIHHDNPTSSDCDPFRIFRITAASSYNTQTPDKAYYNTQTVTQLFMNDDAKIMLDMGGFKFELTASLLHQAREAVLKQEIPSLYSPEPEKIVNPKVMESPVE